MPDTCTCSRGSEGFTYDYDRELWVHVSCGQPTEPYLRQMLLKELL